MLRFIKHEKVLLQRHPELNEKWVTVRLPPETVAQLEDLAEKLARPQWRVMCDAIAVLSRVGLPAGDAPTTSPE